MPNDVVPNVLHTEIDNLNHLWKRVEQLLQGPEVMDGVDGRLRLTVERFCFDGRAVNDCKMDDKIEAAYHLHRLVEARERYFDQRLARALDAKAILNHWLMDNDPGHPEEHADDSEPVSAPRPEVEQVPSVQAVPDADEGDTVAGPDTLRRRLRR